MSEEKQKTEGSSRLNLSSKYWRVFLVVLAAVLTFGGPYAVYVFTKAFELNYSVSITAGFVLFAAGLILIWYLIRKKVIS
jgi:hypothetical protein